MRIWAQVLSAIFVLAAAGNSRAAEDSWRITDFGTSNPDDLLIYSLNADDPIKERIRTYIAAKVPDSPAGLAARSWVIGFESNFSDQTVPQRVALLKQCVAAAPKYLTCLVLLTDFSDAQVGVPGSRVALAERVLDVDPHFELGTTFVDLHQHLLYVEKSQKQADEMLEKYGPRMEGSYALDYDRAMSAWTEKRYADSLALLESAKNKSDAPFLVWQQIARLKTNRELLMSAEEDSKPYAIASEILADALKSATLAANEKRKAVDWYIENYAFTDSFRDSGQYDALYDLYGRFGTKAAAPYQDLVMYDYDSAGALLRAFANLPAPTKTAPPRELLAWAIALMHAKGVTPLVQNLAQSSIATQYTAVTRRRTVSQLDQAMDDLGYTAEAETFLNAVRAKHPALPEEFPLDFDVYMANQDVIAARAALLNYPKQDQVYRSDFERLKRMQDAEDSRARFQTDHAFLVRWYKEFDDRQAIDIHFDSGSENLPAGAARELDRVADLLREPGAAAYLFEVSGHSDSQEALAQTRLSESRAQKVVLALTERGVPLERLRAKGYAATDPMSTNQTEAGRQANRRVEIRPIDNVAQPRIAENLRAPYTNVMLPLSGRRWAIVGDSPSYRFDLVNGTRATRYQEGTPKGFLRHERYLVSGFNRRDADGLDRAGLIIYDLKSGEMLARREFEGCGRCSRIAINQDRNEIAYTQSASVVVLDGDTLKQKRIAVVDTQPNGLGRAITWLPGGKIAVAYAARDHIYIVDQETLKVERELGGVNWVHSLTVSGDNRFLVAGDNGGAIHVWDIATWKEHGQVNSGLGIPSDLDARSDTSEVAVAGNGPISKRIDVETLQVVETWTGSDAKDSNRGVVYSRDGQLLYRQESSVWRVENLETRQLTDLNSDKQGGLITWMRALDSSGRLLIQSNFGDKSHFEIFSITDLSRVYDLTPSIPENWEMHIEDDDNIEILDRDTGRLLLFDTKALKFIGQPKAIDAMLLSNLKAPPPDIRYHLYMSAAGLVTLWNRRTTGNPETTLHGAIYGLDGTLQHHFELDFLTEPLRYRAYSVGYNETQSDSGRYLAIQSQWVDGYGTDTINSKRIYLIDTQSGEVVRKLDFNIRPMAISYVGESLRVKFGSNWITYASPTSDPQVEAYGDEEYSAIDANRRLVYRDGGNFFIEQAGKISQFTDTQDELEGAVVAFPKLHLLVDRTEGLLEVRNDIDLALRYKLRVRAAGEWIAYTEDGHFAASPHGTEGLFWNLGEDYLPFESLRGRFETASLVHIIPSGIAMSENEPKTADSRRESLAIESDVFSPPYALGIVGETHRTTDGRTESIRVVVTKLRATTQPYQLEITINGRVLDKDGVGDLAPVQSTCRSAGDSGCNSSHDFVAALQDGFNVVQVSLVYRNVRINPQTVTIARAAPISTATTGVAAAAKRPQLWFFGVGVSAYKDKTLTLQYPHADALGLANAFKAQEGTLYSKVNVKTIINEDATAETIRLELNRFVRAASQDDIVVVFLAGHGELDETQALYFMTYDSNSEEPYSGFDINTVHEILAKRPVAQKAIVLLDICHAGADAFNRTRGGSRIGSDDAMKALAAGSGVTVITASTTQELSAEGPEYGGGHGAFSYALIQALSGTDAAAVDGGYVTVLSLERYIGKRVQKLTNNRQHPTWSTEHFHDFPLAAAQSKTTTTSRQNVSMVAAIGGR